ncbi:MAG: outer membrane protein assembly factor BamE [Salinarimonadaceae bacterium]|nr:MAG: outer membrane protein assembly factor BamE [Salinarimonadaceae bacterium]
MPRSMKTLTRLLAVFFLAGLVSACLQGEEFQRGYILDEEALAKVRPGMTAEQVLETMGTPSTVSTVGNQSWYYVSQKSRQRFAFQKPEVIEQRVTAIYFTPQLRVQRTALYGIEDGRIFDFISRTTPTGGAEQSFLANLFRGVGGLLPRL